MNTPSQPPQETLRRSRRMTVLAVATAFAGVVAIGTSGVAAAQTVEIGDVAVAPTMVAVDDGHATVLNVAMAQPAELDSDDWSPSPEEQEAFERYDQCLADAGLSLDGADDLEVIETDKEMDEAEFQAAFEQCDPILAELDALFDGEVVELSPEDEMVWDQFDECLVSAGVTIDDMTSSLSDDIDFDALDAAFEQCDPLLEALSEDVQVLFEDCPPDEASAE